MRLGHDSGTGVGQNHQLIDPAQFFYLPQKIYPKSHIISVYFC